jgi:hypothetical protein
MDINRAVIASEACLHAEVVIYQEPFMAGRRSGTQAWQSDEVVARAKPVAISRVPSLCSGQGFVPRIMCGVLAMTT